MNDKINDLSKQIQERSKNVKDVEYFVSTKNTTVGNNDELQEFLKEFLDDSETENVEDVEEIEN